MIEATHAGIAYAAPIPKDRTMHMAKEQVPDTGFMWRNNIVEHLSIPQHDLVHRGYADLEWRVVHEQEDRAVGLVQFAIQPSLACRTVSARMGFWVFCVQQQEPPERSVKSTLHKTVSITGYLWESRTKGNSVVVISDQQMYGHVERFDFSRKPRVGGRVTPMGDVTRQDNEVRITVSRIDRRDSGSQPRSGVLSIEPPVANNMCVSEMDKFHSAAIGLAQSSQLVPVLKTGPSQVNGIS